MTTVMDATTAKETDEIGQAVAIAKATAIRDLNAEYEAIVKELSFYDSKKAELDKNINNAIKKFEIAMVSCLATRQDIENVTSLIVILKDELKISHEEIDNAYCRKEEFGTLIESATEQMTNLKNATNAIVTSIKTATTSCTETIIGDATSYITSHNDNLLHKMETVFAENIQLVEDVIEEYDIEAPVRTAIEINMDTAVTSRLLEDIKNSSQVHDKSDNIIIALEK